MAKRGRPKKIKGGRSAGGGPGLAALVAMLGPQGLAGLEATGPVECRGYGVTLTPWWCIENQLSDFCLPGFPCHDCEAGVTITPPSPPLEKAEIEAEVGRSVADPSGRVSSFPDPGGAPSLKRPKTRKVKAGVYDPKTMSRAVARDLGLI